MLICLLYKNCSFIVSMAAFEVLNELYVMNLNFLFVLLFGLCMILGVLIIILNVLKVLYNSFLLMFGLRLSMNKLASISSRLSFIDLFILIGFLNSFIMFKILIFYMCILLLYCFVSFYVEF